MARFASTGCGNGFWGDREDERGEAEPDNNSLRAAAAVQSSRCEVKGQASHVIRIGWPGSEQPLEGSQCCASLSAIMQR